MYLVETFPTSPRTPQTDIRLWRYDLSKFSQSYMVVAQSSLIGVFAQGSRWRWQAKMPARDYHSRYPSNIPTQDVCLWWSPKTASGDDCTRWPPMVPPQDGFPGWSPKIVAHDGYLRCPHEMDSRDGCPRWLCKPSPVWVRPINQVLCKFILRFGYQLANIVHMAHSPGYTKILPKFTN